MGVGTQARVPFLEAAQGEKEISGKSPIRNSIACTGSDNASIVDLRDHAAGGFSRQAYELIMQSPELLEELAQALARQQFSADLAR